MFEKLSDEVASVIKEEVKKIREEYQIANPIIRNDIFEILEKLCVVLKYPLEDDEDANGLHVERWIHGEKKHFVFINSSNPLEKQVYTAAHELGHVWEIDKKVNERIGREEDSEAVINRFSAELLIPDVLFKLNFIKEYVNAGIQENRLGEKELLPLITQLMNLFMVPYKAIIYRMEELDIVDEENRKKLEKIEQTNSEIIKSYIERGNFQNLNRIRPQKAMGDLERMLICAEEQEIYNANKISNIRKKFDIEQPINTDNSLKISVVIPEA